MKKVFVTGITGFVGKHLTQYLLQKGNYEIWGTSRLENPDSFGEKITVKRLDLLDAQAVLECVALYEPDYLYHLAALTSPAESFKNPSKTITNNTLAEVNLLEALKEQQLLHTRVLIVSTSEIYGRVSSVDLPVDEETPFRPFSPYAVSKITQDYLGLQYHLAHKLDIIRVRPFNHVGPGQDDLFVLSSFAKQIARIEKGKQEPILQVGNLGAKRDFTDVRDIVKAYELLMEKGESGQVYNIGSGKSHKIEDLLTKLLSFSQTKIQVAVDQSRFRPLDVEEIYCDYKKCAELTGWKPEIPIEKTLEDILEYWRKIV